MADLKDRQIGHFGRADSSVHAPAKKGGAGGQYTWGTPMDVQDFVPVGVNHTNVTVAAPVYVTQAPAQPMMVQISDASQFPSLGGTREMNPWHAQPTYVAAHAGPTWGPAGGAVHTQAPVIEPQYLQQVAPIRTTVDFGQQHPRNTFARRPQATTLAQTAPVAIDWSQAGTAAIQQVMQHMPNTAHTSPYVKQHAPIPLSVLQATPQTMQTMMYQTPTVARGPAPVNVAGKITQARGR